MRIFNEDPAFLVPGDLAFLGGAWDQVSRVTVPPPWAAGGDPFGRVFVRVESDPGRIFGLNPDVMVKVAR